MATRYAGGEPIETTTISLPASYMKFIRTRAAQEYKGNKSAVILEALEKAFPEMKKDKKSPTTKSSKKSSESDSLPLAA